jgi:hypothetical protein
MIIVIKAADSDMKAETSIGIVAAVMFTIPMLWAPAQGDRRSCARHSQPEEDPYGKA